MKLFMNDLIFYYRFFTNNFDNLTFGRQTERPRLSFSLIFGYSDCSLEAEQKLIAQRNAQLEKLRAEFIELGGPVIFLFKSLLKTSLTFFSFYFFLSCQKLKWTNSLIQIRPIQICLKYT